jgi:MFS family permease
MVCISECDSGNEGRIEAIVTKKQELLRKISILFYLPAFCFFTIIASIFCLFFIVFAPCNYFILNPNLFLTIYDLYCPSHLGPPYCLSSDQFIKYLSSLLFLFTCVSALFYALESILSSGRRIPLIAGIFITTLFLLIILFTPNLFHALPVALASALFYAVDSISRTDRDERAFLAVSMLLMAVFSLIGMFLPLLAPILFLAYTLALLLRERGKRSRRSLVAAVIFLAIVSIIVLYGALVYAKLELKMYGEPLWVLLFLSPELRHGVPLWELLQDSEHFLSLMILLRLWLFFLTAIFFIAGRVDRSLSAWGSSLVIIVSSELFYRLFPAIAIVGVPLLIIITIIPLRKISGDYEILRRCIAYFYLISLALLIFVPPSRLFV